MLEAPAFERLNQSDCLEGMRDGCCTSKAANLVECELEVANDY